MASLLWGRAQCIAPLHVAAEKPSVAVFNSSSQAADTARLEVAEQRERSEQLQAALEEVRRQALEKTQQRLERKSSLHRASAAVGSRRSSLLPAGREQLKQQTLQRQTPEWEDSNGPAHMLQRNSSRDKRVSLNACQSRRASGRRPSTVVFRP